MTTFGLPERPAPRARRIVFSLVAGLAALMLLTAAPNILAPWVSVNLEHLSDREHARWSLALEGAVDLLAVVCVVGALVRPMRSALLMQYVLYAACVATAVVTPFSGPMFLLPVGVLLLVPLTNPYPGVLFSLRSLPGPAQPLLVVAVLAASVVAPVAVQDLRTQATLPRGAAADFNILATNAEHLLLLALAGLLSATRRPGWRVLAAAVAATWVYVGVASVVLPNQPGSWGVLGGATALLVGTAFAVAGIVSARPGRASGSRPDSYRRTQLGASSPVDHDRRLP